MQEIGRERSCHAWVANLKTDILGIVGTEGIVVADDESNGTSKVRFRELDVAEWLPTAALIDMSDENGQVEQEPQIAEELPERAQEMWQWCLEQAGDAEEESLELGSTPEEAAQIATTRADELWRKWQDICEKERQHERFKPSRRPG